MASNADSSDPDRGDSDRGDSDRGEPDRDAPAGVDLSAPPLADVLHRQTVCIDGGYAGFGRRMVAGVIDLALLWLVLVVGLPVLNEVLRRVVGPLTVPTQSLVGAAFTLVVAALLTAFREASPRQATVGKSLLRLVVTDRRGDRIGWLRASVRLGVRVAVLVVSLAVLMSVLIAAKGGPAVPASEAAAMAALLLPVLARAMQAFTPRHQALHDLIAGTLVLHRPPAETD